MSANSIAVAMPVGYGMAIPHNPKDLLKMIESQKKAKLHSQPISNTRVSTSQILPLSPPIADLNHTSYDRLRKQEAEREAYETRQMVFEDYTYTDEGLARLKRWEDRLNMETEDAASAQLKELFKDQDRQRFRNKIRSEVEARKAAEKAEREEKRRAAEVRRAAVVERLRKQAEMEEQRKREAELALQRIEEEKIRKEREEQERFLANQQQMVMEDQLSALAEQDYRDQVALQAWKLREKEKLAAWEKEQQEKDKRDEELRQQRLAELEIKRKKLDELRQMQQSNESNNSAALQKEGERITKQLRIQNRAKFVSKKMNQNSNNNNQTNNTVAVENTASESLYNATNNQEKNRAPLAEDKAQPQPVPGTLERAASNRMLSIKKSKSIRMEKAGNMYDDFIFQNNVASSESTTNTQQLSAITGDAASVKVIQTKSSTVNLDRIEAITKFKEIMKTYTEKEIRAAQQDILNEKRNLRMTMAEAKDINIVNAQIEMLSLKYDIIQAMLDTIMQQSSGNTTNNSQTQQQGTTNAPIFSVPNPNTWEQTSKRIESLLRDYQKYKLPHPQQLGQTTLLNLDESSIRSLTLLLMDFNQAQQEYKAIKLSNNMDDDMGYEDKMQSAINTIQSLLHFIKMNPDALNAKHVDIQQKVSPRGRPVSSSKRAESAVDHNTHALSKMENVVTAIIQSHSTPTISSSIDSKDAYVVVEVCEETKAHDGDNNTEEEDPSTLSGWEECLYTSMFSAAHHAAYYGYLDVLKFLLKYFDCFILDSKGRTPLYYACLANHLDCVAELVSIDPVYIEVGDQKGETPLHAAAKSNSIQVLAFLLSCEVHPDTANNAGLTSSHFAKSKEAFMILSQANAALYCVDNQDRMPLWYMCNIGNIDCVEYLCEKYPKEYILWPDSDGDTCLHKASSQGHAQVVETLCKHINSAETIHNTLNKKNYTAIHVALCARVLQVFYEYGCNIWIEDFKQRSILFFSAFFGRTDCVEMLMNLALSNFKSSSSSTSGGVPTQLSHADVQGDTALHVASLCGHLPCVCLLSFLLPNSKNKNNLSPLHLAEKANHHHIVRYISNLENLRRAGKSTDDIYGEKVDFSLYASFITYYGARYYINYDTNYQAYYYLDRITNASSWEIPDLFDMPQKDVEKFQKACTVLMQFYSTYNPTKLQEMNHILMMYQNRYTELFITLANKYDVQDLSMFKGVDFDY